MVFFVEANSAGFEVPITHLPFTLKVSKKHFKGPTISSGGVTITRSGNSPIWTEMIESSHLEEWELSVPKVTNSLFVSNLIEDIMFTKTFPTNRGLYTAFDYGHRDDILEVDLFE
jgi:hypothetical protein